MPLQWANFKHLSPVTMAKYHSSQGVKAKPQTKLEEFTTNTFQCSNVYHPAAFEVKMSTGSSWMVRGVGEGGHVGQRGDGVCGGV